MHDTKQIGALVRNTRKRMQLTQQEVALAAGVGTRFISEFERGKPTCQLGKALRVLKVLGISVELSDPNDRGKDGR